MVKLAIEIVGILAVHSQGIDQILLDGVLHKKIPPIESGLLVSV